MGQRACEAGGQWPSSQVMTDPGYRQAWLRPAVPGNNPECQECERLCAKRPPTRVLRLGLPCRYPIFSYSHPERRSNSAQKDTGREILSASREAERLLTQAVSQDRAQGPASLHAPRPRAVAADTAAGGGWWYTQGVQGGVYSWVVGGHIPGYKPLFYAQNSLKPGGSQLHRSLPVLNAGVTFRVRNGE